MSNEMYVVIGEDKETGETWICENWDIENSSRHLMTKSEAIIMLEEFSNMRNIYTYRIAKLSWLD